MGNWLRDALLKKWCEDNGIKIKEIDMNGMDANAFFDDWREGLNKEEKEMTKGARVVIKRIYDELMKWCEERHVMCEFATSDDEGLSATFMVDGTTLSVSHIELRDHEQFSKYVKSVLFGVDDIIIDHLKAQVDDLKKEIVVKDDRIAYLQCELMNEHKERLYGQIGELEEELESKDAYIGRLEKDLNTASDKIIQLACANTSLKGQIDGLKYSLNKEREGYGELKDQYDDKCKAFINMCKLYDTEVTKRMKAEDEINNLKAGRHDDVVDVARYLVVLGKKKRAEEKIRSLKSQVELYEGMVEKLKGQNEAFNKQVDALVKEKLKILAEDDATMDALKKKNATLQYKIDALKSANDEAEAKIEDLLEKYFNLDNHVKNLVAQNEILEREKNELTNEYSELVKVKEFIKTIH